MDYSFLEQLKWLGYSIKLCFTKDTAFRHFYHGPPLYALLCQLLNSHPLVEHPQKQALILIHPVESGQLSYSKGDFYHFAITHIFPPVDFKKKLTGAFIDFIKNPPYDGVFSNNFVVESITEKISLYSAMIRHFRKTLPWSW